MIYCLNCRNLLNVDATNITSNSYFHGKYIVTVNEATNWIVDISKISKKLNRNNQLENNCVY